jgi:hypothetical protein
MRAMKTLLLGVLAIVIIGIGGLVYRNAVEHPNKPQTCPVDTLMCPDGSSVSRVGMACEFPSCPPPNITLGTAGIAFALPEGLVQNATSSEPASIASYSIPPTASTTLADTITIARYPINASSTALETIRSTAIGGASGEPISPALFTSTQIAGRTFTVVRIERFEGVIDTAYYLSRATDVLRFDAIDREVLDWTNPSLDLTKLPAHSALRQILSTLKGQ